MCLIVLAHQVNAQYPLILAANRDEFRQRPTQSMHWWPDIEILAGKDLEAGGTWLALHKDGRWAAVTNYRKANSLTSASFKSRGELAIKFLGQSLGAMAFANTLERSQYAGFNLLLWDNRELIYCANEDQIQPQILAAGVYGLSNGCLNSDWPKVNNVKIALEQSLGRPPEHQHLQNIMLNKALASDSSLPNTGIAKAWEKRLSACFIDAPEYDYGTRTCISVYRDRAGITNVQESCFDLATPIQQHFTWANNPSCMPA